MRLKFECGSEERTKTVEVAGKWVQITYETILDRNGKDIATYNGDFWILNEDGSKWSDVVIESNKESG